MLVNTSLMIGICLFLIVYSTRKNIGWLFGLSFFSVLLVALIGFTGAAFTGDKVIETPISNFSYYHFPDRCVIIVGEKTLVTKDVNIWKTINKNSKIVYVQKFNEYDSVFESFVTVDGKKIESICP
jgi:hypothetical protein